MDNTKQVDKNIPAPIPVDESDYSERAAGFNAGVETLCKKYEVSLAPLPGFTADGRIAAEIRLVSTRKAPETPELQKA